MAVQVRFAARSDTGLVRKNNQDAGYAGSHLLMVADGMGGAAGGDTASSVTVGHVAPLDDVFRADDLLDLLRTAVNDAHEDLVEMAAADKQLAGMGTTCTALLRSGNKLAMVHIGDSRAYLLRKERLVQVTKDHTLVQYLVDQGQLSPEEAEEHPKKNVIMRALGDTEGLVELDESIREAVPGDRWLLCSDGLFGVVSDATISYTLRTIDDPDECADKLIDLALAGGAPDNVTVVIGDVLDPLAPVIPDTTPVVVGSAAADWGKPSKGGTSSAARAAAYTSGQMKSDDDDHRRTTRSPGLRGRRKGAATDDLSDTIVVSSPDTSALDDSDGVRRRKWPAKVAVVGGILLLLVAALAAGWTWTQSQYYVTPKNGVVTIYKGIPQDIGPISLSEVEESTTVEVDQLTQVAQNRLRTPITRGSLDEAREVVEDLSSQMKPDPTESDSSFGDIGVGNAPEDSSMTEAPTEGEVSDVTEEFLREREQRREESLDPTASEDAP